MVSAKLFMFLAIIVILFNIFLISTGAAISDYETPELPELGENPTVVNYISLAGEFIVFFFQFIGWSIIGLPAIITIPLFIINMGLIFLFVQLIRGN